MIGLNLLIGFPQLGESALPPHFAGRMLVTLFVVVIAIRVLDRMIRRQPTGGPASGSRLFRRVRPRRKKVPAQQWTGQPSGQELRL